MATSTGQRVGIWVITGALVLGTLAGFVAMVLVPGNEQSDQARQEKEYQRIIAEYCEEQAKSQAKTAKPLKGYKAEKFDGAKVSELSVEQLKAGKGEKVPAGATISANYFGWTSDGRIFDSTNKDGKTTAIDFSLDEVIKGWKDGLAGQKVGSVVELTIPSEQAYGDTQDQTCRPVGALKFIVEIKAIKEDE